MFGMRISASRSRASSAPASSVNRAPSAFFSATSARNRSNSALSPRAFAAPTSFDAAFCAAAAVSAARILARRASSIARSSPDSGANPRRDSAASNAAGFSRMKRMSCMA